MPYYPLAALRKAPSPTRKVNPFRFGPFSWTGNYDYTMTSYRNYVKDGFERNPIIYAALMYKVRAISQAPIRLYRGDFEQREMVELDNPAWQVWLNPNEHQSMMEFSQQQIVYLNLSGNNYVFLDWQGDQLKAMYNIRPDRIRIAAKEKELAGYLYAPDGFHHRDNIIPILPKNILHIKFPNPDDDLEGMGYGLSPIAALAHAGDIENSETDFVHTWFKAGVTSTGAITYDGVLADAIKEQIREQWMEMYGGAFNWPRPMFLDKGLGWKEMTPPFEKMNLEVLDKRNEARQTAPLGVNGMLIGLPGAMERSTFNNMSEVIWDFWTNTFTPELRLSEVEYQRRLTTADGIFPAYDLTQVPALMEMATKLVAPFTEMVKTGVPPAIAARFLGMNLPAYKGDSISYMPLNLQPVTGRTAPTTTTPATEAPTSDETPNDMAEPTEPGRDELALVPVKAIPTDSQQGYAVLAYFDDTRRLVSIQESLKSLLGDSAEYLDPATFHVTLLYTTDAQFAAIQSSLPLNPAAFSISIDGLAVFDTPDGYAIHATLRKEGTLVGVQAALAMTAMNKGVTISPFSQPEAYTPHITLAYSQQSIQPIDFTPFSMMVNRLEVSDKNHDVLISQNLKSLPEPEHKSWSENERAILWKAMDDIAQSHEQAFGQAATKAFRRDQAEIGAILNETVQESRSRKATVSWLSALPAIKDWLRAAGPDHWREVFLPVQVALVEDTANLWAVEMGLGFDIPNVESMTWFQDYTLVFAQPINETTSKNITDLLTIGQNEGWSIGQMQSHLDQLFQQYLDGDLTSEDFEWFTERMPPWRRELIARTETTRMANAGSLNLFRYWGAPSKEWLATLDDRVRPSHAAMAGQQRPINEPFESGNGVQLRFPGDPQAPLSETAACRCAIAPVLTSVQMSVVRYNLDRKGYVRVLQKTDGQNRLSTEAPGILPEDRKPGKESEAERN